MVGYKWDAESFMYTWISFSCMSIFSTYVGQILSFATPTLQVAILGGVMLLSFLNVLSGFLVPIRLLYTFFKIFYWIDPIQYFLNGVCAVQLHCTKNCSEIELYINNFIKDYRGLEYDRRWYSVLASLGISLLTRFILWPIMSLMRYKNN